MKTKKQQLIEALEKFSHDYDQYVEKDKLLVQQHPSEEHYRNLLMSSTYTQMAYQNFYYEAVRQINYYFPGGV